MTSISSSNAFTYRSSVPIESGKRATHVLQAGSAQQTTPSTLSAPGEAQASESKLSTSKESWLRQALDTGYKALGKVPSGAVTGEEWDKVVGFDNFSRTDLVGIMQNSSGEFSQLEMDMAEMTMTKRHSLAMVAASPDGSDHAAMFRASVAYLDEAGPDEMKTLAWAKSRAAAQTAYEGTMQSKGLTPDNIDTRNAVVELFLKAYDEIASYGKTDRDISEMPSYKEAIDIWSTRQQASAAYFLDLR